MCTFGVKTFSNVQKASWRGPTTFITIQSILLFLFKSYEQTVTIESKVCIMFQFVCNMNS